MGSVREKRAFMEQTKKEAQTVESMPFSLLGSGGWIRTNDLRTVRPLAETLKPKLENWR